MGRLPLVVVTLVAAAVVSLAVAVPLAAAHHSDLPFERAYGDAVVSLVSRLAGGSAANPLANNARASETGRIAYTGSCASCHGASGDGKGAFGRGTYPPATDLTSPQAKEKSDAQIFWIIKNGIGFTGMPEFADQYGDQDIWAMVTYVRALQQGRVAPLGISPPTASEIAMADPHGTAAQRGAAVYFAQGCAECHGATGNAPGELGLGSRVEQEAIRFGRRGMPAYSVARLSDAEMRDLVAYMQTFTGRRRD